MDLGQIAYEGYKLASGGKSIVTGDDLPDWGDLMLEVRVAWRVSADCVKMSLELRRD